MSSPGRRFLLFALLLAARCAGLPKQLLYPQGSTTLAIDQDEASSPEITLKVPIVFYGETYEAIYVNSNGLLSFLTEIPSFFNVQFPLDYPVIAPLYTNVDTRGSGAVFYRETQEDQLLQRAMGDITSGFANIGDFEAKSLFIATWLDVGYFNKGFDKVNTYQAIIASDGTDSYLILIYADGGIQWIEGSGQPSGLPDARAQAGLVSSDGRLYNLKGSGTDQIQNLDKWSNVDNPGMWLFHIGQTGPTGNVGLPDLAMKEIEDLPTPASTCSVRSTECHSKAKCVDHQVGFCCICQPTYYGNGINCLKEGIPLRVNGKVNGVINGINVEQLDLQSYVVTVDGRTYTAVSRVPNEVGFDMQTLNILGGIIAWLFAKPVGNATNGYQLTGGVLNHTADITFGTGEKITLVQHYLGLDVFDQLRMDAEIQGTVPTIPAGTKFQVSDYEEQYSKSSPGIIHSHSSQSYRIGDSQDNYPLTVDQFIQFDDCLYSQQDVSTLHLKVARSFISYEQRDSIVRYAMTAKVTPPGDNDPCIEGRRKCGPDSSCHVDGDTFQCVCNRGYQYLYGVDGEEETAICVDINECTTGTSNCDVSAMCINEPGSFSCQCPPGYAGDGRSCMKIPTCEDLKCHSDATCVEPERGSPQCQCRAGFQGDGMECSPNEEGHEYEQGCDVLSNCSPFGVCSPGSRGYECVCLPGYEGDGYSCVDQQIGGAGPVPTCFQENCWCPSSYELVGQECVKKDDPSVTGEDPESFARPESVCITPSQCICPSGFTLHKDSRDGATCHPSPGAPRTDTMGPTHTTLACNILNTCHPYAQCVFSSGKFHCQCNAGFEGDGYECTEIDVSCLEVDICDNNATCVYEANGKAICMCNPGYQGDGTLCSPIEECSRDADCNTNARCLWVSHHAHHECVCEEGFVREGPLCIHQLPSGCDVVNNCDENARCVLESDGREHVCRCDVGYSGDGFTCTPLIVGCNVLNNCGQGADCLYDRGVAGFRCKCRQGYRGDGITCVSEQTCQQNPFLCGPDATCVVGASGYHTCQCNDGFTGNGVLCKVASKYEGNFLLLNQGMATLRIPFNPTPNNPGRPIAIQYYQMAIGIDVDCLTGRVYWSDITGSSIKSANYDGSDVTSFITDDIESPEGISVDWVNRNIYWTDSSKDTIEMANLETKERKVLVSERLINPRGIAVHPTKGKVFWSDWNRAGPKLEWANLDGSERTVFLEGASVQLPNSLAVDFQRDELCWADAGSKAIECVGISRYIRRTLVSNCSYPFGLTISPDNYYWTDWDTRKIESAQRPSGKLNKPISVPLGGSGKLYGIVAVPENCPR